MGGGDEVEKAQAPETSHQHESCNHSQNWEYGHNGYYPESSEWQGYDEYGFWIGAMSKNETDEPEWKIVESPTSKRARIRNETQQRQRKERSDRQVDQCSEHE